jgi:Mg-chelatase subunit ChlD
MTYLLRHLFLLSILLLGAHQIDPPPDAELVVLQTAPDEQAEYLTLETAFTLPDGAAGVAAAEYHIGEQTISAEVIDAGPEPFYVALLIDTSGSMAPALEAARRGAAALVKAAPPQAHFAVISFDSGLTKQLDFTDDHAAVAEALAGLQSQDGGTCLYDAVHATLGALDRFAPAAGAPTATDARRAVVVFSDGRDELRDDQPQACSRLDSTRVAAAAAALHIPVHTLYADGRVPGRAELLADLARASGGQAVALADATLPEFFDTLIANFTRQWRATARFYVGPAGQHTAKLIATLADGQRLQAAVPFIILRSHLPLPVMSLDAISYEETSQRLWLTFSFRALPSMDAMRIEIIDRAGTAPPIEEMVYLTNLASNRPHMLTAPAALRRNHTYLVRLTPLAEGQTILTGQDGSVSAERTYEFRPTSSINLSIKGIMLSRWRPGQPQMVTALVSAETFAPIAAFDGYLVRQSEHDASPELYPFEPVVADTITTSLAGGSGRYTLVLIARSAQDDYLGTAVHEFDTSARWLEWGWQALAASPWLLALAAVPPLLALLLIGLAVTRRSRPYTDEALPDVSPPAFAGPRLRVEASPQAALAGQTVPLTSFPFTIGREGCSLNLPDDKQLSRRHAQIASATDNALYLSDLDSGHGTFLDGRRLAAGETALLAARRSVIQVGKATTLIFEQDV